MVVPGHLGAALQGLDQRVTYSEVAHYWPSLSVEAIFPGDERLLDLSPVSNSCIGLDLLLGT